MAQKDYVSRGRSTKKAPPPPPSKPLPWIRIAITVALIAGFGFFLWTIKDNAETAPATQGVPSQVEKDPLPQLEDEEWDYPELLSDHEVEIEVKEQEKPEVPYLMQCGSFRKEGQAEEMRAKLAFQGLEAQIRPSNGKNGLWYRVILGPYDYKRDAEKDRHAIRRIGITSCRIWNWNL
ncbi:SPOR domain-containing protein [Aestuariibacter sp. AA17]|uniref:SPOR domain-containing protein n=1 Tax=Fluctibacter corallii TaxID=2984329 RepID=A0ABT3A6K1_9ALTE|nr:SPOR domain-containing protein [Aestuariibacter sp. AA17]MCV2884306.1 SPOR domain-containing protein [Aestuariibacter sp. AA17]